MEFRKPAARSVSFSLALIAMLQFSLFGPAVGNINAADGNSHRTATPIKHVIIIIGENRTFDHIFATYKPTSGESVNNLLSEGIIKEDGTPGPHFSRAHQFSADLTGSPVFELSPTTGKSLYSPLPAPLNGGPTDVCTDNNGICNLGDATSSEDGLATTPINYYEFLTTGGTGLSGKVPDTRINGVHSSPPYSTLPPGPFQLTNGNEPCIRRLRGEPGTSLLPDVATGRLQCRIRHAGKSQRLQSGPLSVGRSYRWSRHQWRHATRKFQHRLRPRQNDHRRGIDFHGLLQHVGRRRRLFQGTRRQLRDER